MKTGINFTRINNDVNGNPRYVCHYTNLVTTDENAKCLADQKAGLNSSFIDAAYNLAVTKAKAIGGKRFHNKQYGGGIVFQSYNIAETEKQIKELLNA